ncbi:hypothetical protein F4820DRAFT_449793 [Hypoxylon rubiginosum]|uniref:Uncharacterized protein n=1 Tax=Hypoxylon rubiginosum TaxID=110542 RepID=A0ACB9YWA2_9PEZI|nr:hypothetical protein F4820DRAFT_449793 [Hypoxylon rubiginosum]
MKVFTLLALVSPIVASAIKRDDIQVNCGQPAGASDTQLLASEYSYPVSQLLKGGDATVHFYKGPAFCYVVSCNPGSGDNAGVTVCNDADKEVDIAYADMAWFAQRVYDKCKVRHDDGKDYLQKGQAFNPDADWNVFLSDLGPNACHN